MKIINKIYIRKFRGFDDISIRFGCPINAIVGKNGTMKTTLLGMLAHPFSLKTVKMAEERPLTGGMIFNSPMTDKFKFSDEFDIPGEHEWTLTLNPSVYEKVNYTCVSERRTDNGKLRFWSTEGRSKGMNFIQCPVIFLSMRRLIPLGEEKGLREEASILSNEEFRLYSEWHNKILIVSEKMLGVSDLTSKDKRTLGPVTEQSDAITISAGQDNIGKIILAILSMRRLKEKYPDEYRGGIIFIDEMENTLYPAAQEKLIEFMTKISTELKIQFFFTTHSVSAISFLKTWKYHDRCRVVYLRKLGNKINVTEDPNLSDIINDLNVEAGRGAQDTRIKVYCEDDVAISITKNMLPPCIKKKVSFVGNMDLSWTMYKTLCRHHVPEFMDNIIVLDGDVRKNWKEYSRNKNIVLLPTEYAPERFLYEYLYNISEMDEIWDMKIGGYSKSVCFRDYPDYIENIDGSIDTVKTWMQSQKDNAGRGYAKFINRWKKDHKDEVEAFIKSFVMAYNYVAEKTGAERLDWLPKSPKSPKKNPVLNL